MNIQVSKDGKIVTIDDIIYIRKDEVSALKPDKQELTLIEKIKECETIQEKFEVCCADRGVSPDAAKFNTRDLDSQCYERLKVVTLALNGGKTMKVGEERYNPYFQKDEKDRFSCHGYYCSDAFAFVSPLLQNPTSELAVLSGNEFLEYWAGWHGEKIN